MSSSTSTAQPAKGDAAPATATATPTAKPSSADSNADSNADKTAKPSDLETRDDLPSFTAEEVEAELAGMEKNMQKDQKIAGILEAAPINAYAIFGILPGMPADDIKKMFRLTSLYIHPDKTDNPKAPEAFDRVKKAYDILLDEKKREYLDKAYADARRYICRDKGWSLDGEQLKTDNFLKEMWPQRATLLLVEDAYAKEKTRKAELREEGRVRAQAEQLAEERRLKRKADEAWEAGRDTRVSNWRDFLASKGGKPGAKKPKTEKKQKKGGVQFIA